MADSAKVRRQARQRRKLHIRKRIHGTAERPRLVIFRSLKHIYASLVDDTTGYTLAGVSDQKLDLEKYPLPKDADKFSDQKKKLPLTAKVAKGYQVGLAIAEIAKEKGIEKVVFDRNGLQYHGRIRAVAVGARKGGLKL